MTRHRTADLEPTTFGGRYTLQRRLAVGGMAEIYLARQDAMAGFEKEIVIKRLRAELADDPRIVEMFLDEARIGALLNHPNIVHVYDVDEHDGVPYIAMEYIHGEELNELCRRGISHGKFLPLEHAVELIRQAAAGLGYFHAQRGTAGTALADQPLEIVHLDISPTNLLVTQDGFLKVIDFGIARARGQLSRTDVLPGKLSYMSPEQAARKPVDHRSDIFSLGIVLYEITVGRRLFRGSPQDIVPRLIDAEIEPPTFARRSFPPALESIVMRTLEKHPIDRYQSAYDLADDLETFLRDERLHSGPVRIARYLDMLTLADGGTRRPELVSEAELRRGEADELDFDSQVFDHYRPAEGAPGPEQAREWEDADQPEADVAAALGLELAELRSLRTPVPTRPAGMAPVSGKEEPSDRAASAAPEVTEPAVPVAVDDPPRRAVTTEGDEDDERDTVDATPDRSPQPRRALTDDLELPTQPIAQAQAPSPVLRASDPVTTASTTLPRLARRLGTDPAAPQHVIPPVGSALLARNAPPRLPWMLVGALVMAVLGLVAYIVMG